MEGYDSPLDYINAVKRASTVAELRAIDNCALRDDYISSPNYIMIYSSIKHRMKEIGRMSVEEYTANIKMAKSLEELAKISVMAMMDEEMSMEEITKLQPHVREKRTELLTTKKHESKRLHSSHQES